MTTAEKIAQLKKLIGETHQHGLTLKREIQVLEAEKPRLWHTYIVAKWSLLKGLEILNAKRRIELARLEHNPVPKPPAPKPEPAPPQPAPRFHMFDSTNID